MLPQDTDPAPATCERRDRERSTASTTAEIIEEIAIARVTERGATRGDDRFSEAAMEDRKREGYF